MKKCSKCNEFQIFQEFNKNVRSKDGLSVWCKKCCFIANKIYREANKNKLKIKKQQYVKNNREKINANKKKYHQANIAKYTYNPLNLVTKTCAVCKIILPISEFHIAKQRKDGFNDACKDCEKYRKIFMFYKLTREEFETNLKLQENKCKICQSIFDSLKDINVDHCHLNNFFRGLLCQQCNAGLGNFKDNIEYLEQAIKYLSESATKVL